MRVADAFFAPPDILLPPDHRTVRPRVEDFFVRFEGWPVLGGLIDQGLPDYFLIFGALSLFGWVGMARIVRSQVLSLRETDYVLAARAAGARTPRILFRHLLPNVTNLVVVAITFSLGSIAGAEIALTWLIGIQPPHPASGDDDARPDEPEAHPELMRWCGGCRGAVIRVQPAGRCLTTSSARDGGSRWTAISNPRPRRSSPGCGMSAGGCPSSPSSGSTCPPTLRGWPGGTAALCWASSPGPPRARGRKSYRWTLQQGCRVGGG
jgi:hypothetical protein